MLHRDPGHVTGYLIGAAAGVLIIAALGAEETSMQLQARPAKQGYTLKSFAVQLLRGPHPAKIDETDASAVVVISSSGEERVLQTTGTFHQAQAALQRFEAKRQKLGDLEFARVYGLPERLAR